MHVIHVARPIHGGVPVVVRDLVEDQVRRGWRVEVACPPESDLRRFTDERGGHWLRWPATRSPGPGTAAETLRLARILRAAPDALVHLHSSKAGLAGRLALRGRRPTLFQPHDWSFDMAEGPLSKASAAWERLAARWADRVVCVSEGERERGRAAGLRARWTVMPNGVDLRAFEPAGPEDRAAARRALGLPADAPIAVLAGRICRQKAQDHLVSLWPDVRARVPGAQLVLVGDGEDTEAVRASAGDGVVFAGWSEDVRPWLVASDVVAIPSRSEAGLSLVAMEAMALARPVVATDVSGMRDGVEPGAGVVVEVGATEALVAALAARLSDPALAAAEGTAGRRRVEERFDLRVTSARMADLYSEVLADRGGN
jgi:glycosyltransferase involved in cell wall biosynthesis